MHRLLRFLSLILLSRTIGLGCAHEHYEEESLGSCVSSDAIFAEYRPRVITVDGHADDWIGVDGSELALLPALDFDEDKAYAGGRMTVKMGRCKEMPGTCNAKSCRGHEVDIMHFSIGNAIPGPLYGGNLMDNINGSGRDSFGQLIDTYGWNPHCQNLDGIDPSANTSNAQNDWQGSWWHSSQTSHSGLVEEDSPYGKAGDKGTYFFEFSRPLRTMDRFQQDVQFSIGQSSNAAAAFWYPTDGNPWHKSSHCSASCNWLALDISSASAASMSQGSSSGSWDAATAFSLLLSVVSLSVAVFVGYYASKTKAVPFTPIDRL